MGTLMEDLQAQIVAATGKTNTFNGSLHDICDLYGIAANPLPGRLIPLVSALGQAINNGTSAQNWMLENPTLVGGPRGLFANGEQGGWYDASDYTTLFEDAAGTIPITTVEKPVGLWLDKSRGLVLGSELVTNGDFSGGLTGWTDVSTGGGTVSTSNSQVTLARGGGTRAAIEQTISATSQKTYKVEFDIVSFVSGQLYVEMSGSGGGVLIANANGRASCIVVASAGKVRLISFGTHTIDNISVKELPGNHAYQSTSANRPTLSARVNLLTYTEQFDNAVWTKLGTSVTANGAVAPNGETTADRFFSNATFGQHYARQNASVSAGGLIGSYYVKYVNWDRVSIRVFDGVTGTYWATFNINLGTVTASASGVTATISAVGNGWYRITSSITAAAGAGFSEIVFANSDNYSGATFSGATTDEVLLWGADLRLTADASTAIPAYQRVTTSTDYDTVGFPMYLRGNGTSSTMATNSIDFTGTNKVTVFAGVTKLADAAQSVVTELSATIASNNGTFLLTAPNSAAANFNFSSKGTTQVDNTVITYTAPTTAVIAASADIAAPSNSIKVNGAAATTVTGSQGTGNYGNFALNLFARSGGSLWLNGRLAQLIVRGAATSAAQISSTERWVAAKTGVRLLEPYIDNIVTDAADQIITDDGDSVVTDTYYA